MNIGNLEGTDDYGDRSPTLVCDYSENDLNLLFLKSKQMEQENGGDATHLGTLRGDLNSHSSPGKVSGNSGDKFNQMTRLDDEEENVDFIAMFNQYQMQQRN